MSCQLVTTACTDQRLVNNGDGTVTDRQTKLQWERKSETGCPSTDVHCVDNMYTWFNAMSEFVSEVNGFSGDGSTQTGLGGHSDWRLPTSSELQSIVDTAQSPTINPAFGPTQASIYWSSTSRADFSVNAWFVFFNSGGVNVGNKSSNHFYVRAVRGGL